MFMQLRQLLDLKLTFCQHPAASKKALLFNLSQAFSQHLNTNNENDIFEAFIARERLGSTSIGHGIAIPHIRCPHTTTPLGALVQLKQGIDFGSHDKKPIDLVFALMVPQQAQDTHLIILAHLAKLFHQPSFLAQLRNAQDNSSLYNTAVQYDFIPAIAV